MVRDSRLPPTPPHLFRTSRGSSPTGFSEQRCRDGGISRFADNDRPPGEAPVRYGEERDRSAVGGAGSGVIPYEPERFSD